MTLFPFLSPVAIHVLPRTLYQSPMRNRLYFTSPPHPQPPQSHPLGLLLDIALFLLVSRRRIRKLLRLHSRPSCVRSIKSLSSMLCVF